MDAKELRGVDDQGEDGEGEQGEGPAHGKHDGDDVGEGKNVFKDGEDAGGEHFVERVDVGGDAGNETTDGIAIEKGDVHALEVAEDFGAEIEHDLLAGPLHEVGLDEFEQKAEDEGTEVEAGEFRDAGHGDGAEVAGEPGVLAGGGGEIGIDGDLDEIGAEDVGTGLDEDGEGGDAGLELVGGEVAEQAAHDAAVVGLADHIVVDRGTGLRWGVGCRRLARGVLGGAFA